MKEKKKRKTLKRLLPFICAALLLLGSSMTVFAGSSVPVPSDDAYCYRIEVSKKGENVPYRIYYTRKECYYVENMGVTIGNDYYYYADYSNGLWNDELILKSATGVTLCIIPDSSYDILYSNYDIYYKDSNLVFYHPLLVTLSREVLAAVQKQTIIILPIAVGCLALLIGSMVLLPRLKSYLER